MSARRPARPELALGEPGTNSAEVDLREVFDRVHDGDAVLVDPNKTALALFVTNEGAVRVKSPYPPEAVVKILRDLADKLEADQ